LGGSALALPGSGTRNEPCLRSLLAGTCLAALAILVPNAVHGQNATWTGTASGDWNTNGNWSPATIPTGQATFDNTGLNHSVGISANASINTIMFSAGAPTYSYTISGAGVFFNILGTGIVNNSSSAQTFVINNGSNFVFNNTSTAGNAAITNNADLSFVNSSTAGATTITNNNVVFFVDTSTAGAAAITNNGGVAFNGASMAGNATIINNGGVAFTGTSTAGNATITNNNGILFLNSSTAGNAAITNNNNLSFSNSSTAGNATITNATGAIINFVDTTTAGNATITSDGRLSFAFSSTAGSATIITNAGLGTTFADSSTGGNARLITNAGGTLDFSGTSGPAGDGKVSAGSIEGAGTHYLGANQLTVGGNNLSTTVSGVISDCGPTGFDCQNAGATGGGLTKVGSGTLILSGTNTYTGPTNVNAGILAVNGSLASTVFVNAGGTLMGGGTIGGLGVQNGGIVAPGNSIGTMTIAGNASFAAGSIYQVEANAAGQADKIAAAGGATLNGGTVQVLAQNGTYARQTRYTILTAAGGVTGTFSNATSNLAFLTPTLSYDANDVFLTLSLVPFSSIARTPNQAGVAGALDRSPTNSALVQAVLNQTGAGALRAFDALSGEVHGSVQTTMLDDSRYAREAVLGRLRQMPYAGTALGSGGPLLAYADDAAASLLAYADAKSFPVKAQPRAAPAQASDLAFWMQGIGAWGSINNDGNAADVSRNLAGVFTGFDRRFGDWRAGLAGGYTNASLNVNARASSASIETGYLAGYAGTSVGAWNFRSGAAVSWNSVSTSRAIAFPGFAESASARYGAGEAQVFGEIGYGMALGALSAELFAGLAWMHLDTRSFNETGGVAALAAASRADDIGFSTLGGRAATNVPLWNGMVLTPRASAAWLHAFGTVAPTASLAFQSTGAGFAVAGVPLAREAALVEAGLDLQLGVQAKLGVFYAGQLASSAHDHSVKGNLTWRF